MSSWHTYALLLTVLNFQIKIIEKACFLLTYAAIPGTSENTWAIFPKEDGYKSLCPSMGDDRPF